MNSGQMMLVMGAMALLSVVTLNINGMIVGSVITGTEMEATLNAVSLAQTLLDEILVKDFDEKCYDHVHNVVVRRFNPDEMSVFLGPDNITTDRVLVWDSTLVSKQAYDDVDDYNQYSRITYDNRLGYFYSYVTVYYVKEDDFDDHTTDRTFAKRINVLVANAVMIKKENKTVNLPDLMKTISGLDKIMPIQMSDLSIYRRYF
jgi:hypothetical protein